MRGSGCSGGAFDYFAPIQSTDGYDAIEAIAAQPWVQDNKVGMVGISYAGISQLYVAADQPPSLLAITPISVVDSSALYTLYPGGILNNGFALGWAEERDRENRPFGQAWTQARIAAGDTVCDDNQDVRLQNPGLANQIGGEPVLRRGRGREDRRPAAPPRHHVPVFLAGAWQDEQTGGHFANMLDRFTGTDQFYASLTNGLHTESLSAGIAPARLEFLDLYVAHRTPSLQTLAGDGRGARRVDLEHRPDRDPGRSVRRGHPVRGGAGHVRVRPADRDHDGRGRRWHDPARSPSRRSSSDSTGGRCREQRRPRGISATAS